MCQLVFPSESRVGSNARQIYNEMLAKKTTLEHTDIDKSHLHTRPHQPDAHHQCRQCDGSHDRRPRDIHVARGHDHPLGSVRCVRARRLARIRLILEAGVRLDRISSTGFRCGGRRRAEGELRDRRGDRGVGYR
jgi:hypothetical protein